MPTPLFELFQTINSHYLYDANKNQICPISPETAAALTQVKQNVLSIEEAYTHSCEIAELQNNGFLSDRRVEIIEHPYTNLLDPLLSRRVQKVTLQLTQNCNFRCAYCHYTSNDGHQRTHANRQMPIETAKEAIRFLREHSIDTPEVFVGFYGGEPLLEFPMLKEMILFAESELRGKTVHFMLTTNATLLTDEIITFFIAHKVDLLISIDGNKEAHDKNRVFAANGKGTFDAIIKKLEEISQKYPDYFKKITINMVLDPSVDFDQFDSLFKVYPFMKKVHVMSTIIDDEDAETKNQYEEQFTAKERYQIFLRYLNLIEQYPEKLCSRVYSNQGGQLKEDLKALTARPCFPEKAAPGGPCVPGEVRPMVTVDGNLVICERVSEISEPMIIGNIWDGFDMEKVYALLNVAQATKENCRNCWAFTLCNLCAKASDTGECLSGEKRLSKCAASRASALVKLKRAAFVRELTEVYGQAPLF